MTNNTTSIHPTHFLRGIDLVEQATKSYLATTENWAYPSQYRYGIPVDDYYAEIWVNGMDWQHNYWVIEEVAMEIPQIEPFIIFEDLNEEKRFNHHDFNMLVRAALYYRRDYVFVNNGDYGYYTDMTWPYLYLVDDEIRYEILKKFVFKHASQPAVEFWMNPDFVPEYILVPQGEEINEFKSNVVSLPTMLRPVS